METITMYKNNFKMAANVEVPNEREVEYPHFSKVNFKTNIKFYGCNHRYKG
jgi:hypothetical protein